MIIMLLVFIIMVIFIIGLLVEFSKSVKEEKWLENTWFYVFLSPAIVFFLLSIWFSFRIATNRIFYYRSYQNTIAEREIIVKHLENETFYISVLGKDGKSLTVVNYIEKAYTFNAKIEIAVQYGNNAFTNWFYNKGIVENAQELYIDVESYFSV